MYVCMYPSSLGPRPFLEKRPGTIRLRMRRKIFSIRGDEIRLKYSVQDY